MAAQHSHPCSDCRDTELCSRHNLEGSIQALSLTTTPQSILMTEKGMDKYGHRFNMCLWSSWREQRVQSGVDASPKANILAATCTFCHNALRMKWYNLGGTLNARRCSQTPESCLSSIRTVSALALRILAKDHTSTGVGGCG